MPLIYVVDDEEDVREVLRETLETRGYDVRAFPDGASVLAATATELPSLFLLDINMPGMTGWRVREALRQDPRSAGIPVIAVTAQGGAAVSTSALRTLGFAGFIRKPFRVRELWAGVETVLPAPANTA